MTKQDKQILWIAMSLFALGGVAAVVWSWSFIFTLTAIFFIYLGFKFMPERPRFGLVWLGASVAISVIVLGTMFVNQPAQSTERTFDYRKDFDKQAVDSYTCPHCAGLGGRVNQVTGHMGKCSSCGGDGLVTEEQYGRLSK